MKTQWGMLLALLFAILIALFAVMNVESVEVDYFFGTARWPLILVVLGSVLAGVIIMGAVGMTRIYGLKRELKRIKKERDELEVRSHLAAKEAEQPDESWDSYNPAENIHKK
ncbi:LapA family protein [Bacillus sp. T33-2]|uniref:LapA family protein n=1 Tax=Bacillus sp. T33-2 TaxID=2054168 RepID=UPI000C7587B8|nr:lipopolysaccharide assembly protein LapA domain-containing protein [Bacillus sp. T33-2]PLR89990.1 DUF1049 domain-containing protein [Bacillus sp. T33-2]